MHLKASCYCNADGFECETYAPVPCLHCHYSICRKTAGGCEFC